MAQLLISATNAQESIDAADSGADWVDLKDPTRGSLGLLEFESVIESLDVLNGRLPVSIALGELVELGQMDCLDDLPLSRISRVKVGLADTARAGIMQPLWRKEWQKLRDRLPTDAEFVAVHYADWHHCDAPQAKDVLLAAVSIGCKAFLVDTHGKQKGTLLDYYSPTALAALVGLVKNKGMEFVAAGSLGFQHLAEVVAAGADILAVRGAVCEDSLRKAPLCSDRVIEMKRRLQAIELELPL